MIHGSVSKLSTVVAITICTATHLEIFEEIAVSEEEKAVGIQRHAIGLKARAHETDLARESSRKRYLANKQAVRK